MYTVYVPRDAFRSFSHRSRIVPRLLLAVFPRPALRPALRPIPFPGQVGEAQKSLGKELKERLLGQETWDDVQAFGEREAEARARPTGQHQRRHLPALDAGEALGVPGGEILRG